jgi:signal transduction histidine kinase
MCTALFALTLLLSRRARSQRVLAERAAAAEHSAAESAERAAASERERIAREMHDVVAHSVTIAVVQCVAALDELDRSSDPTAKGIRPRVEAAEGACREALAELRRMLSVLRYEATDTTPAPRLDTLGHLAESVRRTGLAVDLAVEGDLDRVPPGIGLACYRIVQESLTNTLKHADASRATVDITVDADQVRLRVEDDGRASLMTPAGGNGLVGMRERAGAYAGTLQAGPREFGGYRVEATLPLDDTP